MAAPKKMGLSLYADLLGQDKQKAQSGGVISGAPVKYNVKPHTEAGDAEAQQKKDASLRFQPIRRPQVQQKGKPKQSSSSAHKFSSSTVTATSATASSPDTQPLKSTPLQPPSIQRSNFEDWVGDEEEDFYLPKAERGGRKKWKKKKQQQQQQQRETRVLNWDDIYDPSQPSNYAEYKGSDEQYQEGRDWKARLYYHQLRAAKKAEKKADSDQEDTRPRANPMFAPPANLNFAPPSFDDRPAHPPPVDDDDYYPPAAQHQHTTSDSYEPPVSFANDATGDDAYMRRVQLSGQMQSSTPPATLTAPAPPQPAIVTVNAAEDVETAAKKAKGAAVIAAFKAKIAAQQAAKAAAASPTPPPPAQATEVEAPPSVQNIPPPPPAPAAESGGTISRAPVRYQVPPVSADVPMGSADDVSTPVAEEAAPESDAPRSKRPGQAGFAERLMQKHGWQKGQGLGAQGDGIVTAIVAKVDKAKKGENKNMGKLVGGKRRKLNGDQEEVVMSEVVKLEGMCKNMDLDHEIQDNDLWGEIGREMAEKYGNVERVFMRRKDGVWQDDVWVKFTSALSAVRCVNDGDGIEFNGNKTKGQFFETERFDRGVMDHSLLE